MAKILVQQEDMAMQKCNQSNCCGVIWNAGGLATRQFHSINAKAINFELRRVRASKPFEFADILPEMNIPRLNLVVHYCKIQYIH